MFIFFPCNFLTVEISKRTNSSIPVTEDNKNTEYPGTVTKTTVN